MRLLIARVNHETNSFSPLTTPLDAFSPKWGEAAREAAEGSTSAMGAFLAFARERQAEIVTPVFATANPSGPVADAAFEQLSAAIVDTAAGCDAILLDLHGAMMTESIVDAEGELLARVRKAAPGIPIGVALDLHGNITERTLENCDVVVGFKTYPHVDMSETGSHVAALIGAMLEGAKRPSMARVHPPLLPNTLPMNTTVPGVMQDLINMARAAECRAGVLAVSVFGGFALSDFDDAGLSVIAVADSDDLAADVAREIATAAWERRSELRYVEEPLPVSIGRAKAAAAVPGKGPVLLIDHGDNCMSGGTCDTMQVLEEALAQGLDNIIAGPICDPVAVRRIWSAGTGAVVDIGVGNRVALGLSGADSPPLRLRGIVTHLGHGEYTITGPTYTGMRCSMGRTAVLTTDSAKILIAEQPHEPWDKGVFSSCGIDPEECRFLILKSRMYCRPTFGPLAKAVVECASLGVTSSDFSLFRFRRLPRPIYPLDIGMDWVDRG